QGYRTDSDSGLLLLGQRYYDPSLGRFISRDPTGYGGGDPNLYRYSNNNPVNASDPNGTFVQLLTAVAGAALLALMILAVIYYIAIVITIYVLVGIQVWRWGQLIGQWLRQQSGR